MPKEDVGILRAFFVVPDPESTVQAALVRHLAGEQAKEVYVRASPSRNRLRNDGAFNAVLFHGRKPGRAATFHHREAGEQDEGSAASQQRCFLLLV